MKKNKSNQKKAKKDIWGSVSVVFFAIVGILILLHMYIEFLSIPRSNREYTKAYVEKVTTARNYGAGEGTSYYYEISYNANNSSVYKKMRMFGGFYIVKLEEGSTIDIYYDKYNPEEMRIVTNRNYTTVAISLILSLCMIAFAIYYFVEKAKEKKETQQKAVK